MTKTLPRLLLRSFVALAAWLALSSIAPTAKATPNFPGAIATHLGVEAQPRCAICHNGGVTGRGTVTTPFGKSMRAHGLVAFDEGSLGAALDQLTAEKTDSIGDGTDDVDDLKAGRDPNVPDGDGGASVHVDAPIVPAYGCGARIAPRVHAHDADDPRATFAFAMAGVVLILAAARRRGRRSRVALAAATMAMLVGCHEKLDVASDVDLQRFQGKWYEIAKLPRSTQSDCTATTASYSFASNGDLVLQNECHLGQPSGPLKSVAMRAKVDDPSVPAKLSLDIGGFYGDYWILEVGDHYEYAVIGTPSRAYLWILSRTPTLDEATMRGLLEHARAKNFDTSRMELTKQL
jgi:apolipoprotein D and lipocalin family protein